MVLRCCFTCMVQLQQTSCTRVLVRSNSWKLRASRILTVFISTADNASLTLLVKEDSSRTNPFLGLWFQLLSTFAWCSCACQRLLRFCAWSRFHNASQSVPSIEGSVHDTHHILVPNREFLRIRGTPLHCAGTAQSDQSGSRALLFFSSRRRSTPFLVHTIHFIVLQQVVFISNLTKNPAAAYL